MILAGDVGGTKCNIGLFQQEGFILRSIFQSRLPTRDYSGIEALIEAFLKQAASAGVNVSVSTIDALGFGVAGVVVHERHYSENLPWILDSSELRKNLKLKHISLLNDLAATALSLERLSAKDFVFLNAGRSVQNSTKGVIAAGTGLGEALLFWDGKDYRVSGAEGGMANFAPRTEREIELLSLLGKQFPHVSNEEIVSGRGFRRIHEFLNPVVRHASFDSPEGNAASEITQLGLAKKCAVCEETINFWVEIFGGVAGNFALQTMALGGIYIAGGIPVKILTKLQDKNFFRAFCGESKLAPVLAQIPIAVVLNEDAPVWGAAYAALTDMTSSQAK